MKKYLLALFLGLTALASADYKTADNGNLDGNWMNEKGYKEGSPANESLNAQVEAYNQAKDAGDTAEAERLAIRSWVKGWYAAELGRLAFVAGDKVAAKAHFLRAKSHARAAQLPSAGRGEVGGKDDTDGAPAFGGTSKREGIRVAAYADKWLNKIK